MKPSNCQVQPCGGIPAAKKKCWSSLLRHPDRSTRATPFACSVYISALSSDSHRWETMTIWFCGQIICRYGSSFCCPINLISWLQEEDMWVVPAPQCLWPLCLSTKNISVCVRKSSGRAFGRKLQILSLSYNINEYIYIYREMWCA